MGINRRSFIKGSAASVLAIGASGLAASSLAANPKSYRRILGSNEKLRMAVIGFNSRGQSLISAIRSCPDAELVALCDVDEKVLNGFDESNKDLARSTRYQDILDAKDIDGVASATPNHWHTLIAMLSCQAGKHVYIEKPISHNMHESRQVVKAARKFNRIVQCGFQNRSDSGLIDFYRRLHSGDFGAVQFVHATCHRQRDTIGKLDKPLVPPASVDYDRWLGPAIDMPLMRPKFHYDWHWDFNTGNGDVGNQGPHEWDLMNWALGNSGKLPSRMVAAGNRFGWDDAGNTPNVMACFGELNGIPFCFEVMDLKVAVPPPKNTGVGVVVYTDKGYFAGGRGGGTFFGSDGTKEKFTRDESQKNQDGTNIHFQNFVGAVAAGDFNLLACDCAIAANSSAMAHMANISYRLGAEASMDELKKAFGARPESSEMIERLSQAPKKFNAESNEKWVLGPDLNFDIESHEFRGTLASQANEAMTRDYRAGYELPDVE